MKSVLLIISVLLFVSCKKKEQSATSAGNFKVEFLFENDGCKMYRFLDGGRYIYYSDCTGKIQYSYTTGGSKNRSTHTQEALNN